MKKTAFVLAIILAIIVLFFSGALVEGEDRCPSHDRCPTPTREQEPTPTGEQEPTATAEATNTPATPSNTPVRSTATPPVSPSNTPVRSTSTPTGPRPTPTNVPNTFYLPALAYYPNCLYKDKTAVSWIDPNYLEDGPELCAGAGFYYYLNSRVSFAELDAYRAAGGILDMYCLTDPATNSDFIDLAGRLTMYDGRVLLLDEPDTPTGCSLGPHWVARALQWFEMLMPYAHLTWPNISPGGIDQFRQAIVEYENLTGTLPAPDSFGFHVEDDYSVVDDYCSVLGEFGIPCTNISITQFRSCSPANMGDIVTGLGEDGRISFMGVYSNRNVGCYSLFDSTGRTAVGDSYLLNAINQAPVVFP